MCVDNVVTFSNIPTTAYPGATLSGTWTSSSQTMTGDIIILYSGSTTSGPMLWIYYITAGLYTGTFTTVSSPNSPSWKMPSIIGATYIFGYYRNGLILGTSVVVTCISNAPVFAPSAAPSRPTSVPTNYPSVIPTSTPTRPTSAPSISIPTSVPVPTSTSLPTIAGKGIYFHSFEIRFLTYVSVNCQCIL